MKERMTRVQFENELLKRLNGERFQMKRWNNYPNSVFYYREGDDPTMADEIGIFTSETTYGIYIKE